MATQLSEIGPAPVSAVIILSSSTYAVNFAETLLPATLDESQFRVFTGTNEPTPGFTTTTGPSVAGIFGPPSPADFTAPEIRFVNTANDLKTALGVQIPDFVIPATVFP